MVARVRQLGAGEIDWIVRIGQQDHISRVQESMVEVEKTFFGTDQSQSFSLGIDIDIKTAFVISADRFQKPAEPPAGE